MSGHSKWSTIKRQKGVADARRGATFTKISNAITIAVKRGGGIGDPDQNPKLRLAIEMARDANMPNDNISRAVARALSKGEGELEEVTYEGFAPGGISVLVEAITDNTNRTTAEVKSLFNKWGARFAEPGAVSYQFEKVGEVRVLKNGKSIDDIFMSAAELGAQELEDGQTEAVVYTDISSISKIKEGLTSAGFDVIASEVSLRPITKIAVEESVKDKIVEFLLALEDMDDVQKVYSNISL